MSKGKPLIEVIACSVADAVAAEQGGAGRLEVVSELGRGGLTPPLELVQEIIQLVSIPVRVMLRGSDDGYEVPSETEKDRLCAAAGAFSVLRIEGFVLGFLHRGGIDVDLIEEILAHAPSLRATIHHAFEETEPLEAIRDIKRIAQADRILTHGGAGSWTTRIKQLAKYQAQSRPEIGIIAGGGLNAEKIAAIASLTEICEFHVGRAARAAESVEGVVEARRVKQLVEAARHQQKRGTPIHEITKEPERT